MRGSLSPLTGITRADILAHIQIHSASIVLLTQVGVGLKNASVSALRIGVESSTHLYAHVARYHKQPPLAIRCVIPPIEETILSGEVWRLTM